jgi:hypothetical protein
MIHDKLPELFEEITFSVKRSDGSESEVVQSESETKLLHNQKIEALVKEVLNARGRTDKA